MCDKKFHCGNVYLSGKINLSVIQWSHLFCFHFHYETSFKIKDEDSWINKRRDIFHFKTKKIHQPIMWLLCLWLAQFYSKKDSFPDVSFISHRTSFVLNTSNQFFRNFWKFWLSLFGPSPVWTPTRFSKAMSLRYGPWYILTLVIP